MNFFERQSQARRKTQILLFYFVPAVVLTVLAVYFVVAAVFLLGAVADGFFHPVLFPCVAGATLLLIIGGSCYKMWELSEGGCVVAVILGGSPVNPQTADPEERQLLDVVEEMAIASGVPMPQVFVLRQEQGINSFAAGFAPGDTVIGVTQGALKLLTRDELQGIVAHEFSHILNGDAHLNLWMMGAMHGILCISLLGKTILRGDDADDDSGVVRLFRSRRRDARLMILAALLVAVGAVGHFFGSLIKSAVCRKREELADASAVQFTRNPLAIAGALKKIGGMVWGSKIQAADGDEANHIFFGDIAVEPWFPLLRTHPRLRERILLLDPQFDGNFPRVLSWAARERAGKPVVQARAPAKPAANLVSAVPGMGLFNTPSPRHLAYAAGLQASFDPQISDSARESFGACALVFAVLLSSEEPARQKQLADAGPLANPGLLRQAQEYFVVTDRMSCGQKLALFSLCLTGLRQMSAEQFRGFCEVAQALIESDRTVSLFEYALHKSLRRNLACYFQKRRSIVQYYSLQGLRSECAVLLSALARHSSDDPQEIERAFQKGKEVIAWSTGSISLLPWEECNLPQIDAALDKLSQGAMPIKKQLVEACAGVVACDGMVEESEAQLLRAIAEALDSPLPPLVAELGAEESRRALPAGGGSVSQ